MSDHHLIWGLIFGLMIGGIGGLAVSDASDQTQSLMAAIFLSAAVISAAILMSGRR